MAIHRSTIKRRRQSERKHQRNIAVKSRVKTLIHRAAEAPAEKREEAVRIACASLDRAATKRVVHPNTAARRKSRLVKKFLSAPPPAGGKEESSRKG